MTNRSLISFLPLIALAALTGCATSQTTYLNNGEQGLSIDCSGEANSWATCYEKADASCAAPVIASSGLTAHRRPRKTTRRWASTSATTKTAAW